jgi:hypothetical protein
MFVSHCEQVAAMARSRPVAMAQQRAVAPLNNGWLNELAIGSDWNPPSPLKGRTMATEMENVKTETIQLDDYPKEVLDTKVNWLTDCDFDLHRILKECLRAKKDFI